VATTDLKDKWALITGGTSGMGSVVTRSMAAASPGDQEALARGPVLARSPRLGAEIQLLVHATQSTGEQLTTPASDSEVWSPLGARGPERPAPQRRKPCD
jgi:NAD(P)-dependent dehydrogenase (short-subunit alcohol dehydrogenase family)